MPYQREKGKTLLLRFVPSDSRNDPVAAGRTAHESHMRGDRKNVRKGERSGMESLVTCGGRPLGIWEQRRACQNSGTLACGKAIPAGFYSAAVIPVVVQAWGEKSNIKTTRREFPTGFIILSFAADFCSCFHIGSGFIKNTLRHTQKLLQTCKVCTEGIDQRSHVLIGNGQFFLGL